MLDLLSKEPALAALTLGLLLVLAWGYEARKTQAAAAARVLKEDWVVEPPWFTEGTARRQRAVTICFFGRYVFGILALVSLGLNILRHMGFAS